MSTQDERIRIIVDLIGEKAYRDLERDALRYAEATKRVATQQKTMTRETQVLTRSSRQLGNRLQNSAFQLGDFLVQVEAGVPATRAFGQQASQLLGAFGPWGAVLGVAAATVPILVSALRSGEAAAADAKTAIEQAQEATGRANQTFSSISFENWNREFNSAAESTRRLYASLLNIDELEVRRRIAAVRSAIVSEMNDITAPTVMQSLFGGPQPGRIAQSQYDTSALVAAQRSAIAGFRNSNLMEEFGVDEAGARTVSNLFQSFESGLIDMTEFSSTMVTLAGNTEGATDSFFAYVRQLAEAEFASRELLEIQKQQNAVQESLATGVDLPTERQSRRNDVTPEEARIRADIAAYDDLLQRREKERTALVAQAEAYRQSVLPAAERYRMEQQKLLEMADRVNLSNDDTIALLNQITASYRSSADAAADAAREYSASADLAGTFLTTFDRNFQSFVNGVAQGTTDIGDAFKRMSASVIADLMRIYLTQQLTGLLLGGVGAATGSTAGIPTSLDPSNFARGGAFKDGIQMFARGGVVNAPTIFPMARGIGLMGEAGAEGIFPLGRLPNGDMGVKGAPPVVNVNVTNNSSSADVQVARDPAGNVSITVDEIRAVVAGDIARGGNAIADSIASSFGLPRTGV